jgi:predicted Zn-dependent protease
LFQPLQTWFDRRRALRELRLSESQYSRDFGNVFTSQIELAAQMLAQGHHDKALEIWQQMHARFPGLSTNSDAALNLLLDLGHHEEAEQLMQEGRRRNPSQAAFYATALARVAYRRGDPDEAIRRCETLLKEFPGTAEGYHIAATCLHSMGRQKEADAMMARGVLRLPDDFNVNVHYAHLAMHRNEWPEALRRWELMRGRFENSTVPLGLAQCLRELDRFAEAEQVLIDVRTRYGTTDSVLAEMADLAAAKGDFDEAVRRWKIVIDRFPQFITAYTKCAEAMSKIGKKTEADEVLHSATKRFRSDLAVHVEYARTAHRRHDWTAAAERWTLVCARFPGCKEAHTCEAEAIAASRC